MNSMKNIKLTIEYDGTNYCGWQVQAPRRCRDTRDEGRLSPDLSSEARRAKEEARRAKGEGTRDVKTIQGTVEEALKKILRENVRLVASGRTDSGVHAKGQAANFKTESGLPAVSIMRALNAGLPEDIAIIKAEDVPLSFHSRFDAKSKVYRYAILNRPCRSALNRQYFSFLPYPLDAGLMKKEAESLTGKRNFKSFHASGRRVKDFIRRVKRIDIRKTKKGFIYIDIEADGFLYNMARNIVGTLLEVGRGKMPPGSLRRVLKAKNRKTAGPTAEARGLCLLEVKY